MSEASVAEWEDITDLCRNMAEELKQTEKVCPMIFTPTFSLHDSMSAVEIMDPKMDQCCGLGSVVDTYESLYKVEMPLNLSFQDLVHLFQRMITLEVTYFSGYSVMESTHTCLLMWQQCWPYFTRDDSITSRIIYAYLTCMVRTLGQMHQCIVTADVYEDEDFNPQNRSTIYDGEMNDDELISRIDEVIVEVQSTQDEATATLVALLTFCRDFCQLACHLEKYTFNTIDISGTALREKQRNPESRLPHPDFPNPDFISTFSSQILTSLTFLSGLKQEEDVVGEGVKGGEKVEMFFRPLLARLMLMTPVRAISIPTLSSSLSTLMSICRDLLDMYAMTVVWQTKGELSFEFLLTSTLQLCHTPTHTATKVTAVTAVAGGGGKHIIARSFFIAALHTTAITLDQSLIASMIDRGIPPYIACHEFTLSWVRTTPMVLAWDMLKMACTTRNRILHRLVNTIIPTLGVVVTEGLMLDEQMRRDTHNVNPEIVNQWNVAFATCLMTFHGDLYLQLLLEQGLIDVVEHDYVFWQWDHMLTCHMACLDRIRAMRLQIDIKTYEDWTAKVEKKKTQIAQQQDLLNGTDNSNKKAIEDSSKSNTNNKNNKKNKKKKNQREIDTAVAIPAPPPFTTALITSAKAEEQQVQLQKLDEELAVTLASAPPTPVVVSPSTEDYLRRGKAMLCRGIFRVSLALKQLGLLSDPRNEYCSKESIFNRRFSLFADILSPNPLTFPDFLNVINRDALNKPQFAEQARLATEQEATFLADIRSILQQAMTLYQQARKHFDEARKPPPQAAAIPTAACDSLFKGVDIAGLSTCTADQAVLLVKVVVASTLATTKLLQYVSEGSTTLVTPANIKLRLKVNFSYHRQFPVYEIVTEDPTILPTVAEVVTEGKEKN